MLAEIAQAGGPEECVGRGVRDGIGIAVAVQPALPGKRHAAEHQGAVRIVGEAVDVEALADPNRHQRPSSTRRRAQARSSGTVSLRLSGSPGTTTTRPPQASTNAASSVPSAAPVCAARSALAANA